MKKLFSAVFAFALLLSATSAFAQKFGHINTAELLQLMPEQKEAAERLETLSRDLRQTLEEIMVEYNKKAQDYELNQAKWAENVKVEKQKELQRIGQSYQEQNQAAEQDYADMYKKLLTPIEEKAQQAIKKVAKENGFTYVFHDAALSYFDAAESIDILPLVKKELGIK